MVDQIVPANVHYVCSKSNRVLVSLDALSRKFDVKSIIFTDDPPEFLASVELIVGGERIIRVDKEDFQKDKDMLLTNLCGYGLKFSKCSYMTVNLQFIFDTDYLLTEEKFEMVPEVREIEDFSDVECEIYDGYEYHVGKRVYRREETTGNYVRHITYKVVVQLPDILFKMVEPEEDTPNELVCPVWHTLTIPQSEDPVYIQRLRDIFELKLADDGFPNLDAAIASKHPFTCKVKNKIRYTQNMAGLYHSF